MGALADSAGVYDPDRWHPDATDANLRALNHEATLFLRQGGSATLSEFVGLSPEEKAALALAGDKIRAAQAAMIAHAARSPRGELEVLAPVDGGEALVDAALGDLMDRAGS